MTNDSFNTLDTNVSSAHLIALETSFGTRRFYDSVSYCNRCGSCLQSCPSYRLTQDEVLSPRGRNQAIRLLLERKLKSEKNMSRLIQMVQTCTLCGRCTQVCAGKIPTAQHLLELKRFLHLKTLPATLYWFLSLRAHSPKWFYKTAAIGLQLRRWGFVKLVCLTGLARLCGCGWLHRADKLIPSYNKKQVLIQSENLNKQEEKPTLIYLPSLETELFLPDVFNAVYKTAAQKSRPLVWSHTSSGLFEYIYGDIRQARIQAKHLIQRHLQTQNGQLPLLTDSIDIYIFLKQIANLFEGFPFWKQKAQVFSTFVRFSTDYLSSATVSLKPPITTDNSSLFCSETKPFLTAHKILQTQYAENFVKCTYTADIPAFGYSFTQGNWFSKFTPLAVEDILKHKIKTLVVFSGWSLLEWTLLLRKISPETDVIHIAQVAKYAASGDK